MIKLKKNNYQKRNTQMIGVPTGKQYKYNVSVFPYPYIAIKLNIHTM